jgi:hypothetical protein
MIAPRGAFVVATLFRGLIGELSSAFARKNCRFADWAATTRKSTSITDARMLSLLDTG